MAPRYFDELFFLNLSRRSALKGLGATAAAGLLLPGYIHTAGAQEAAPLPGPLDPVALDTSPAQAFASHKARGNGIARHYAMHHPLSAVNGKAEEDTTTPLLAHFHAAANDPSFSVDNVLSRTEAPKALRRLNMGDGLVGTGKDYDMALKVLVVLAYRYARQLDEGIGANEMRGVDFILQRLVPPDLVGGHPTEIETKSEGPVTFPETENHLLMIESSRYLFNQLRLDREPGNTTFDNRRNGLASWLLRYMQTIAKHDFLEFNARPYQRHALHPILNLHEFARDEEIKTAAQILLDYTMVKFALSSNRARRVGPLRRHQHRINHTANERNDLYAGNGDQVAHCFLAYTGLPGGPDATLWGLPWSQDCTLLAGTAAYRPPPAAYTLALRRDIRPSLHRFYHGTRPELPESGDIADGGLEIYYHSPSFLLSAGGQFLNSGYGRDEFDIGKNAWEGTSRAQATTLIPTRSVPYKPDFKFHDLIRFEPYPDPQVDPYADDPEDPDCFRTTAVNIGVGRGIAAGANLRPAEKKTILEHATSAFPSLTSIPEGPFAGLYMAWKGSGNDNLNVGRVQYTSLLGIDGVEGVEQVVILRDTSDTSPALAYHDDKLFIAWRGSGNENLNVAFFQERDDVLLHQDRLVGKSTFGDSSDHAPALVSHNGNLYLAWTGRGNDHPNLARVVGDASGLRLEGKVVLDEESDGGPALASHNGRLFLAWRGNNDNLNVRMSRDDGATFPDKRAYADTSDAAPSLASLEDSLFMAWRGSGNESLNVAKVDLVRGRVLGDGGLVDKVVLGEISEQSPALGSYDSRLFVAWKGEGEDKLNLRVSADGSFQAPGPWIFRDLSELGFYMAAYRTPPARPEDLDPVPDTLGIVYVVEEADMNRLGIESFREFRARIRRMNGHLPDKLDYGGIYRFHALDDKSFSIWFQQTGLKYKARVVDLSEPLGDLDTLPLVSGEVMSSPGGHAGRIEIRPPATVSSASEAPPLVLDYSDARHPVRNEDKSAEPTPWVERVQALCKIAAHLEKLGRRPDMHAALGDAALLYDELIRLDPSRTGTLLAPAIAEGLSTIGFDTAAGQQALVHLADPLGSAYPAIAQALLRMGLPSETFSEALRQTRRLRNRVPLEVVVFHYEATPGVTSPRTLGHVRSRILHAAILKAWNERYGTQARDLEEILVP